VTYAGHSHQDQPVLEAGKPLTSAEAAMIMLHGRGATAASILQMADVLDQSGFAYLAPQAQGNTWYPYSFLAPLADNEPGLSSALAVLSGLFERLEEAGISTDRIVLLGFSQGACLATEFAARNARRYGGVCGLSGGLIGPPGTPRDYPGDLNGTPVFLGCSDIDPHIPLERVDESAAVLRQLGGEVTKRIYPGMGHTVNADEIGAVRGIMETIVPKQR
jgi:predicted esterase